jgi:hypothetical protein
MINTVEDWRKLRAEGTFQAMKGFGIPGPEPTDVKSVIVDLDRFYQDTERCFEYGKCAFYDLCDYGIDNDTVNAFEPATWNPLLKRTPMNIEVAGEGIGMSNPIDEIKAFEVKQ